MWVLFCLMWTFKISLHEKNYKLILSQRGGKWVKLKLNLLKRQTSMVSSYYIEIN